MGPEAFSGAEAGASRPACSQPGDAPCAHLPADLEGLGYKTTAASSGKIAQDMLKDRGGEFRSGMTDQRAKAMGRDIKNLFKGGL